MQMWLKEECLSGRTRLLYCIVPSCRVSSSMAVLCHVLFHPVLLYAIFLLLLKVRRFQLCERTCVCACACVCMCLWGPGMKPTATASSDLMQKAAGSNTIHYSLLCASSLPLPLSPVIMVSPVTKHFVTHGRKP